MSDLEILFYLLFLRSTIPAFQSTASFLGFPFSFIINRFPFLLSLVVSCRMKHHPSRGWKRFLHICGILLKTGTITSFLVFPTSGWFWAFICNSEPAKAFLNFTNCSQGFFVCLFFWVFFFPSQISS